MKGNYESLQTLVAEVDRVNREKQDFLADTRSMQYTPDGTLNFSGTRLGINEHAMGQMLERRGIPRKFWDNLGEYDPGIRADLINNMWADKPETRYVRTLDGNVRAFMSRRFRAIDNHLVLGSAMPVILENQDLQVVSKSLTQRRMYIQVVFPRLQGEVRQGDVIQGGITLSNSEVGAGAIDVRSFLWRLVCSNGMVGTSIIRRHHVGTAMDLENEESYEVFQDDTITAELNSFRLRLRDVIRSTLTDEVFQRQIRNLRDASERKIDDIQETVRNVTKVYGIPQEAESFLIQNMGEENSFTQYGMGNAMTRWAQEIDDRDRQFEIETQAHELVSLSGAKWKALAA